MNNNNDSGVIMVKIYEHNKNDELIVDSIIEYFKQEYNCVISDACRIYLDQFECIRHTIKLDLSSTKWWMWFKGASIIITEIDCYPWAFMRPAIGQSKSNKKHASADINDPNCLEQIFEFLQKYSIFLRGGTNAGIAKISVNIS